METIWIILGLILALVMGLVEGYLNIKNQERIDQEKKRLKKLDKLYGRA